MPECKQRHCAGICAKCPAYGAAIWTAFYAQRDAFSAAVERGEYAEASRIMDRDVREFLPPPPPELPKLPEPKPQPQKIGGDPTLTAPQKCGIIEKIIFAPLKALVWCIVLLKYYSAYNEMEDKNMKATLYIESDNGGRAVALNANGNWYICDCAPSGYFGDIDILDGTEEEAAARIRAAIESGNLYTAEEYADDAELNPAWRCIVDWTGMNAADVENSCNADRSCEFTTLTEI